MTVIKISLYKLYCGTWSYQMVDGSKKKKRKPKVK